MDSFRPVHPNNTARPLLPSYRFTYPNAPSQYAAEPRGFQAVCNMVTQGVLIADNGDTPIHCAARTGNLHYLELFRSDGCDLSMRDDSNLRLSPIHTAVIYGHLNIVTWFLNNNVNVDIQSGEGLTPLAYAVKHNNESMAKLLISWGANLNFRVVREENMTLLHLAIKQKSSNVVRLLLQYGASTTLFSDKLLAPIHLAVTSGDLQILHIMISFGVDLSLQTKTAAKDRPIHLAARQGLVEIVTCLLDNGVPRRSTNGQSFYPLHKAAYHGQFEVVRALVQRYANVNARTANSERQTPLHVAVLGGNRYGNVEVIKLLLELGADVNAVNSSNYTPLHLAVARDQLQCLIALQGTHCGLNINSTTEPLLVTAARYNSAYAARWLIRNKYPFNIKSRDEWTPLHFAAYNGSKDVAKLFVSHGMDVNARDNKLRTPLFYAVARGHYSVTECLLKYGANIFLEDTDKMNPVHYASRLRTAALLELIFHKCGKNITPFFAPNKLGDFPIHMAAAFGISVAVKWFIARNISVNIQNMYGSTPLINAAFGGHTELVGLLLEMGANVNAKVTRMDNRTALHYAAELGNVSLVRLLLTRGADVNARTSRDQTTPLFWAAERGNLETIKVLMQFGADVSLKDAHGKTVMERAHDKGRIHVVLCLNDVEPQDLVTSSPLIDAIALPPRLTELNI